MGELYDYWNGENWELVDEIFLTGIDLEGLISIIDIGNNSVRCEYKNNKEEYYKNITGTWKKLY